MKGLDDSARKAVEVIALDIAQLPEKEIQELFSDLPVRSLNHWLNYYVKREQYEVCKIIKEYIDKKGG